MAKAQTGVAGPVVVEIAYRNVYIALRGQASLAEEAWQRSKCRASPPGTAAPEDTSEPVGNVSGAQPLSPIR